MRTFPGGADKLGIFAVCPLCIDVLEQKILRLEEQKSGEKDMAKQAIKEAREVLNSLKK